MSRTEDYLDGLLNSVASDKASEDTKHTRPDAGTADTKGILRPDDDFLSEFEKDLLSGDEADDFLRQFEKELAEEEAEPKDAPDNDTFFENLDGIVNSVKEEKQEAAMEPQEDIDIMVDTLGDLSLGDDEAPDLTEETEEPDGPSGADEAVTASSDDEEGIMELLHSEGEFSDIEDMLKGQESDSEQDAFSDALLDSMDLDAEEEQKGGKKKKKKEKKSKKEKKDVTAKTEGEKVSFWQKLSLILFGPDEEEEEKKAEEAKKAAAIPLEIEDLTDENLEILKQLEGTSEGQGAEEAPAVQEEVQDNTGRGGKKGKKEKKEKKEKEKKPEKEKKEKLPKEPDNAPRLPKVPVILIFVMSASLLVLIMVGTNLFGYSNSMSEADREYGLGNYKEAYQQVAGLEVKDEDIPDYEKYRIMANVTGEYGAYQSFMEAKVYDMALDSLIRTIGRCGKYSEKAGIYGCLNEVEKVRSQAVSALSSFGISEEQALELYANENRNDYSTELYRILADAGLKKVEE